MRITLMSLILRIYVRRVSRSLVYELALLSDSLD